jgi:HEPN domain-containing protein
MKQTAVEWLVDKLKIFATEEEMNIIELAKEMEKEQIIDAFVECWKENMPEGYECKQSAEYYYNENYKNK